MNFGKKKRLPEPHIPFISLADIAWQIIIFFLVAATIVANYSLNLDLPSSSTDAANKQSEPLTIQAGANLLMLNGKNVDMAELQGKLTAIIKDKKTDQEKAVVIQGKDDLTFQQDCEIMYAIQRAGGVPVLTQE